MWKVVLLVLIAGAIGGVINAFTTDNGFPLPRFDVMGGNKIWRPVANR